MATVTSTVVGDGDGDEEEEDATQNALKSPSIIIEAAVASSIASLFQDVQSEQSHQSEDSGGDGDGKLNADVVFLFGKKKKGKQTLPRLPCHTLILSASSRVFKVHFKGDWKDAKEVCIMSNKPANMPTLEGKESHSHSHSNNHTESDNEEIEDGKNEDEDDDDEESATNMKAHITLIKFIYTSNITLMEKDLFATLSVAHRYEVYPLIQALTAKEVFEKLGTNCLWQYLSFSILVNDKELKERCLDVVDDDREGILFNQQDFLGISVDSINSFIERDTLSIPEKDLFRHLVLWFKEECIRKELPVIPVNQKIVMLPFFHKIRMNDLLQDVADWYNVVTPTGFFSYEDFADMRSKLIRKQETGFLLGKRGVKKGRIPVHREERRLKEMTRILTEVKDRRILTCFSLITYQSRERSSCKSCKIGFQPNLGLYGICFPCQIHCHAGCMKGATTVKEFLSKKEESECSCPRNRCIFRFQ